MKKYITAALACAMIISSLCACAPAKEEMPALPEKYSLMDEGRVTSTKDQHSTGMCAAFSVIKASESSIITNGYAEAEALDLSEAQLFYYSFSYQDENNPDNLDDGIFLQGDRTEASGLIFRYGGHSFNFLNTFANGYGPVNESVVEFDVGDYMQSVHKLHDAHENGDISMTMSGDYLLTDMNVFRGIDNDNVYQKSSYDVIKQAIFNDGAVSASTAFADDLKKKTKEYTSFYVGVSNENIFDYINHGITIIGWDDNFSKENFGYYKPENDGAWLVQNSMGTNFGKDGLYWSSYEEELAGMTSVDFCPRDYYGDILFHDSLWLYESIRSEGGDTVTANVFSVEKDCRLKAVGVPTSAVDQPVGIEIYRNPDAGAPDSGKRIAKLKTTIDFPGYHVIDLEKAVDLSGNDTFSIVVTYKTDKSGDNEWLGRVPVEGDFSEEEKSMYMPMFEYRFCSQPGESFAMHGGEWHDTSEPATAELFGLDVTINNFGIKALMENDG